MAKFKIELQVYNERTERWDLFGHNAYTNFWWRWLADDEKRMMENFELCLKWWRNTKSYCPLRARIVRFKNNIPTVMMIEKEIQND